MTETELRALLTDAKVISQDALESNNTGFDDPDFVCDCDACDRFRGIISRIDAALAEPSLPAESLGDGDFKKLERERDEAHRDLGNLLARIHRDGGHYQNEHGTAKAVADADLAVAQMFGQLAEARAEIDRLRNALASVSLYEYESTSSASEKVHACARIARKALYGDKP